MKVERDAHRGVSLYLEGDEVWEMPDRLPNGFQRAGAIGYLRAYDSTSIDALKENIKFLVDVVLTQEAIDDTLVTDVSQAIMAHMGKGADMDITTARELAYVAISRAQAYEKGQQA